MILVLRTQTKSLWYKKATLYIRNGITPLSGHVMVASWSRILKCYEADNSRVVHGGLQCHACIVV